MHASYSFPAGKDLLSGESVQRAATMLCLRWESLIEEGARSVYRCRKARSGVRPFPYVSTRPYQHSAKFTLIRLPLLTSHSSICAHFAPNFSAWRTMHENNGDRAGISVEVGKLK
jgi:hypothetical protein